MAPAKSLHKATYEYFWVFSLRSVYGLFCLQHSLVFPATSGFAARLSACQPSAGTLASSSTQASKRHLVHQHHSEQPLPSPTDSPTGVLLHLAPAFPSVENSINQQNHLALNMDPNAPGDDRLNPEYRLHHLPAQPQV